MPYPADPAIIFDTEPGDMFVMRNVANMCPEYAPPDQGHHGTCAAIEYAVTALKVPLLMVLGKETASFKPYFGVIQPRIFVLIFNDVLMEKRYPYLLDHPPKRISSVTALELHARTICN